MLEILRRFDSAMGLPAKFVAKDLPESNFWNTRAALLDARIRIVESMVARIERLKED